MEKISFVKLKEMDKGEIIGFFANILYMNKKKIEKIESRIGEIENMNKERIEKVGSEIEEIDNKIKKINDKISKIGLGLEEDFKSYKRKLFLPKKVYAIKILKSIEKSILNRMDYLEKEIYVLKRRH